VNIVPTVFGEACVMRVLDRASIQVDMGKMGFLPDTLTSLRAVWRALRADSGCGPTGSGKSTTLYAALNSINRPDVKILTAENPVEYNLPGIVQVNINQEIGFDFAAALRRSCGRIRILSWSEKSETKKRPRSRWKPQ